MLYEELPAIEAGPLDGWGRWLMPALILAAAVTVAVLVAIAGASVLAWATVMVVGVAVSAFAYARDGAAKAPSATLVVGPDYSLIGSTLGLSTDPVALTTGEGSLLVVNAAYRERFGAVRPPIDLAANDDARQGLELAQSMAWRDGAGCVAGISTAAGTSPVEVERVGSLGNLLLWRFPEATAPDPLTTAAKRVEGVVGDRLAAAGVLAAVVDGNGIVLAANQAFAERAIAPDEKLRASRFSELVELGEDGQMRLVAEGEGAQGHRAVHIPVDLNGEEGAGTFLLFDSSGAESVAKSSNLQTLLDILPIGLALVDRDGRFLTMNEAFRQAAGIKGTAMPVYPGDLVVKEDKAPVADAVRRNARGPAMSGDLAVRLSRQTSEPVALTIAGLRGLGDAAVLLLLKDNSEEAKLKRQIAQATKMQVVGQLAGGVAHDFNNILTAIIGHCDLMLMRHTPGDSDYDDIQQIKSNSNRAAGLTRQLLAFSRQQTLRPQVLQLPDVVSEVSHLLKRLLGETVELVVKHGRNLGPIRADPGQLEQVIINLAVNARDAMGPKGGGILTIQTYSVKADQVAELGSDVLPVGDYSALSVADTGTGIPPNVLGKIFEPFFTTKEIGKGTGLGLSTVYGIIKQSGGFIFADSKLNEGARFVIYLPVHREAATAGRARRAEKTKKDELWGSGTVLLVEDEPMVRNVAERALTRHGYTVITADNGEEALEIVAKGEPIDLLISDVVMPGMDGPTVVREARKSRPDLKILFMSGYAEEQLRKSIDIENVNFLAKPFSVTELAEAARRAAGTK
jgi:two-component system, cell cycle sensor histidine kinase and response regulator CckA